MHESAARPYVSNRSGIFAARQRRFIRRRKVILPVSCVYILYDSSSPHFLTYKYLYKYTLSVAHIVDTLYYRLYMMITERAITSLSQARRVTSRADPTVAALGGACSSVLRYEISIARCRNYDISAFAVRPRLQGESRFFK